MTARERRALVLGGGIVIAAAVLLRVLPWSVRSLAATGGELRERLAMLGEARRLVAGTPALRDLLALALRGFAGLAPEVVEGRTQAEASAGLTSLVTLLAARSPLKVVRLDPMPDSAAGVFRPVTVHGEFEGDVRGLAAFLRAVETGRPLLTVRALSVVAPEPVPRAGAPEALRIEAGITGWYLSRWGP